MRDGRDGSWEGRAQGGAKRRPLCVGPEAPDGVGREVLPGHWVRTGYSRGLRGDVTTRVSTRVPGSVTVAELVSEDKLDDPSPLESHLNSDVSLLAPTVLDRPPL